MASISSKTITIKGTEVELVKHPLAKRFSIKMAPNKTIRVSMPRQASFVLGQNFVKQNWRWVESKLPKIEQDEKKLFFSPEETIELCHSVIHLKLGQAFTFRFSEANVPYVVELPTNFDATNGEHQLQLRQFLVEVLRVIAKNYLPQRLQYWSEKLDLPYKKVFIKNMSSRWGSCSSINNINLNLHLLRLPEHLCDYVLVHELVHTRIKNHSAAFWTELEHCMPGALKHDKALRAYRTHF